MVSSSGRGLRGRQDAPGGGRQEGAGILKKSWPAGWPGLPGGSCLSLSAVEVLAHPQGTFIGLPFSQLPKCEFAKHSQVVAKLLLRRHFKRDLSGTERMSTLYH